MELVQWVYNNPRLADAAVRETRDFLFDGRIIRVYQQPDIDIDVTKNTAFKLWDGAYLLSRYIEHLSKTTSRKYWENKRVVELGSGCGLVGIVAWLLGAYVTLTDLEETVAHTRSCIKRNIERLAAEDLVLASKILAKNASLEHTSVGNISETDTAARDTTARNTLAKNIHVMSYRWGDDATNLEPPFDFILGSDIVYQPEAAQFLISAIKRLGGPRTVFLLSYKPRGLGEERFFEELADEFRCTDVSQDFQPVDFLNSEYKIFRIARNGIN